MESGFEAAANGSRDEPRCPPGMAVRLRNDPGRTGTLTGRSRKVGSTLLCQVRIEGMGLSWQPEYELEPIDEAPDLFRLLEQGQFGRARDLRRGLTHITLSGRLSNVFFAMRTTNTSFLPYQYKPLLAMLDSPANGILIADEVGLGKTIEAGLIWTELRARFDAKRLLVVCPAMLCSKWRSELSTRFGVDADIVNAKQLLEELRQPRHQARGDKALVCSLQGIRPPKGWRDEEAKRPSARGKLAHWLDDQTDLEPAIDLLVIDEAHYARNPDTRVNEIATLLRAVSAHVALLSATPINLHSGDLHSLLKIVDPDSFHSAFVFDQVLQANEPLIAARREVLGATPRACAVREQLAKALAHPLLASSRVLRELINGDIAAELGDHASRVALAETIERVNPLARIVTRTRKVEVDERRIVRDPHLQAVPMTTAEEELYAAVTWAIRDYARLNGVSDGFLLAMPQRMVASCMVAAASSFLGEEESSTAAPEDLREAYEALREEDTGDDVESDEPFDPRPLISHIRRSIRGAVDVGRLREQDSKCDELIRVLKEFFAQHPAEKVVLFSYFKPTLEYLEIRLSRAGVPAMRLVGGMAVDKQALIDEFRDSLQVRVLLASEVAAEGVDLQFCRVLVNYDLPWNPMRVEQRIGRIDRIGQTAKRVSIWNLYHRGTIDERIVERLYQRLRVFEQALGGLEVMLGEQISQLTAELLSRELTAEEEARLIEQRALVIEARKKEEERLEQEAAGLVAHGRVILDVIRAADELHRRVTEEDLYVYVRDYLDRHQGRVFRQFGDSAFDVEIQLPPSVATGFDDFLQRRRMEGGSRLGRGVPVKCRFHNLVTAKVPGVEVINQFHPIVHFINEELEREKKGCFPLVALRLVKPPALREARFAPGVYAFFLDRWSFAGIKTEEALRARAVRIEDGLEIDASDAFDLVNAARLHGADWEGAGAELDLARAREAIERAQLMAIADFERTRRLKEKENDDRAGFQIASLERHLSRKLELHRANREKHLAAERKGLASAEEKKLRTLEDAFEAQRARLQAKARLTSNRFEVCAGVVRLG